MNIPKLSAFFETSLASSLSASGTTISLVSSTDRDGSTLTGLYGLVIDPDTADREYVLATVSSTLVSVVYRGLDAESPNTEVSGNKNPHRRGAIVKISDYPLLGVLRNLLNGEDTLPSKLKYDTNFTFTDDKELIPKKYADELAIAGSPDASTSVKGISRLSTAPASPTIPIAVGDNDPRVPTQAENDALAGTSGSTISVSNKFVDNADTTGTGSVIRKSFIMYGGDGTDGALSISSGTTTLDAAGAKILVKNYTSISITGTAKLSVNNPHAGGTILILRSQGDVTITSSVTSIDLKGIGATSATNPNYLLGTAAPKGVTATSGIGGAAGAAYDFTDRYAIESAAALFKRNLDLVCGAGGGTGMTRDGAGGAGGRGGGALLIECGGALNFTGTIDVSGNAGSNGASGDDAGGGGGGGSCGMSLVLYRSLTANSGTYTATGGAGGASGAATGSGANAGAGGGGGAGSYVAAGGAGGTNNAAGSAAAGLGAGGGGGGSDGVAGSAAGGSAGGNASTTVCLVANNYYL